EIVVKWFEVDDDYDLLTDLVTEVNEKKYLFVSKDSIDVIIMCLFHIKTNLIEVREKKRLGIPDLSQRTQNFINKSRACQGKIDDFIENIKSQRAEFNSSESSTEEINDKDRKETNEGVKKAGLIGYKFNTVGVSDAISMGTIGMRYSLQSRDLIADSTETMMGGQWYDANISLPGCDKNMPECLIAMGRHNRPSLMVYGGTIRPGRSSCSKDVLDIISVFQSYDSYIAGSISEDKRYDIVRNSCPGPGACGGMYTANTMASAIETLGMTLPYSSSIPAEYPEKQEECLNAGEAIRNLLEQDIKPRDIMTRKAFENAMVITMILGGSTNAVLHLIAIAKSVGIELTLEDFQKVSDSTPFLADLKPSGKYVMEDLYKIGGVPAVLKYLLENNLIHGDTLTVTGKTLAENLSNVPSLSFETQDIIHPLSNPIKPTGHIQILYGNLAPEGSVAKITGKEGLVFSGIAKVFDSEVDMLKAFEQGEIKKGQVIIIRYEGPKGGPGMPEIAIMDAGLRKDVALLTDGKFSGHVTPEAQLGGPIALVKDGDRITIDANKRSINLDITDDEFSKRRQQWSAPPYRATNGTLYKYIKNVKSASEG
ncbi:12810_t:CDS:2, partial [Racocetra fulgida]